VEALSTRTVQSRGHTQSATSCAVPCSAGNLGMYQQSSFHVITLFSSEWLFKTLFICSDATIRWTYQQSNHDDGPTHHGLTYCFNLCTAEFTRSEATDCTRPSCVVRGFESVSGYYHSSFHRVRYLSPAFHLIYLFDFQDWTKPYVYRPYA
jgi:hypothetical protein